MLHLLPPVARPRFLRRLFLGIIAFCALQARAADAPPTENAAREPWTTSQISGSPEPPLPYVTERVFPEIQFNQCLDLATAPGSDRLFIVEQTGKIFSFPNRPDVARADLVCDLAEGIPGIKQVYALAFHPDFATNRYCYVCYIQAPNNPDGTHVARFRMHDTDPPTVDLASETTIITWLSGGHNGCSLVFGPDGYLYISTGDGAPANPPDTLQTGQDVSDLLSSILRIDVDHHAGDLPYAIPTDNPFVDLVEARGEVWAYGLRNPWRMSFDAQTGDLWVGDVGWELWEMLHHVERGGNYGWAVMEGEQATNPEWPRGPTPILPPTIGHLHTESSSITEGLTYYGRRLPELHGTHLYGDYDTGKIWGFRYDQGQVVEHVELADTTLRIVDFGTVHNGEFLILDHPAGTLHRLIPNLEPTSSTPFPTKLSETGLFSALTPPQPSPGVLPYKIKAEPWADHALAERWVAIPGSGTITTNGGAWNFPADTVLAKTLSLALRPENETTPQRIETQILHFNGQQWQPYTYRWNDAQTEATLVALQGAERELTVIDPAAPGGQRQQTWRFAGRAECQRCHNRWSGPPLAFNTPQLNRSHTYQSTPGDQLDTLGQLGYIDRSPPTADRPHLADPHDPSADLGDRARSYLQANCAHCHRLHAGGSVLSLMHFDLPLAETKMLARPSQGTFGIPAAQVIAPGDPFRSVLLYRMSKLGPGRMPRLGSAAVDLFGVDLISRWLASLPEGTVDDPQRTTAAALRGRAAAHLDNLRETSDTRDTTADLTALLASTSGALQLLGAFQGETLPPKVRVDAIAQATQHEDTNVRDLFERFLPAAARRQRLGSQVQPEQILSLKGNPAEGRRVFFETTGVACKNCHRIGQQGKSIGPDLTKIGKTQTPAQLLESILQPSKRIDPKFITYLAELDDGRLLSGLLREKTDAEVTLQDARDQTHRIATATIEELVPQRASLMPDLLVQDLTAQQLADLLAYLASLH